MWNGLALFLIVNLLKPDLGLDLIDPRSSFKFIFVSETDSQKIHYYT